MFDKYAVYLRDADLLRIGEITQYSELTIKLVFSGVSRWIVKIPVSDPIVKHIIYGRGIVVEREGLIILSGPIEHISQRWSENEHVIEIAGADDTVYLHDRLALPVTVGPPYTGQSHDTKTGVASTVLRQYVNANIGPGSLPSRQRAGLVLGTDPLIGSVVTGNARFDNLLELLQSLAQAGGDIGFKVVHSTTAAQLVFSVYQPVDRTQEVIFSPKLGNLKSYSYSADVAEANHIVVGGGGEGIDRVFYEQTDSNSVTLFNRRIEQFRDRRDTSVTADLQQTANEELLNKASKSSLSITPIDTEGLEFSHDYNLGDKVTVVADSTQLGSDIPPVIQIQDIVREINIHLTDSGEVIEPSIGTPESGRTDIFSIFSRLGRAESRIRNMERR